ncbi:hypothetical protein ES705_41781 [subsurface metagenome]
MRKFIVISIVLLMLAGFAITSSAQLVTVTLFADQTLPVGTLTVEVVGTDLVVTYDIFGSGWELLETHIYVGVDPPSKSAPGRFPYVDDATDGQYIRVYNLGVFTGTLCIAAHAEIGEVDVNGDPVVDENDEQFEETAWALAEVGIPIGKGKNWATYFEFEVE